MIYIYKNNQQSGPYEEHLVLDQLKSGLLKPDDMAIRPGESQWQPLRTMFPQVSTAAAPPPVEFTDPVAATPVSSSAPEAQYRNTILEKVFFGLCFLGAIGILAATVYYILSFGPSGNLEQDLSRMSFRDLGKYAAIGMFVGGFFMFLAFVISFKRKLIRSNGARIALRVFFVFVLLAGLGIAAFGALSYLNYSPPMKTKASESNELLRALEAGSEATGPYETAAIALPIGAGLLLFGLSGILMAKRPK